MNGTLLLGCFRRVEIAARTSLVYSPAGRFAVHEAGKGIWTVFRISTQINRRA
jgi:hypothetical protein